MTTPIEDSSGNPLAATGDESYNDIISNYLTQWGMSDLIPVVQNLGLAGASSDQINLTLQQTPEWQQRFAGNAARQAAGLAPLDPATYLGLEDQYMQSAAAYNLPAGFVTQDLMNQWIGGDVSASEVADRMNLANQAYLTAPDSAKQAWDQFYGNTAGAGGAVAAILDPGTAENVIQNQVNTAAIGGAAISQGLKANLAIAGQAASQGVSLSDAQKAYSDIAGRLTNDQAIAGRFGQSGQFGQTQEEQATLLGSGAAQSQQSKLYAEEASQFAGHGAASDTSNDVGNNF